jgi:hypothetical protein
MISWKSRLYAFLLKRVLGPLLDTPSLDKLHQSIEVSLQDGRLVLKDVAFNLDYIEKILVDKVNCTLRIREARIARLQIALSLEEHIQPDESYSDHHQTQPSTFVWRIMELTSSTSPKVSLVANLELDGVVIELEPQPAAPFSARPPLKTPIAYELPEDDAVRLSSTASSQISTKSTLSVYMESVYSSLRLSVRLNDLEISLCSGMESGREIWLSLHCQSVSYYDAAASNSGDASDYTMILHKVLEFSVVSLTVGETHCQPSSAENSNHQAERAMSATKVALLDGSSQVRLRVMEYQVADANLNTEILKNLQQDIQIMLKQRLNLLANKVCLVHLSTLVDVLRSNSNKTSSISRESTATETRSIASDSEADLQTLDGIMKQYKEARYLADRREIRGGMLLPDKEGNDITFDAFFDANDKSFYRYSTVLQQSTIYDGKVPENGNNCVHTKIHVNLDEAGLKISFGTLSSSHVVSRPAFFEEYILATFADINVTASMSALTSDIGVSLTHIEVDDSQAGFDPLSQSSRVEIGSVLRCSSADFQDTDQTDILLGAPCISLSMKIDRSSTLLEVAVEPLEITYRHSTVAHLVTLLHSFSSEDEFSLQQNEGKNHIAEVPKGESDRRFGLEVSCPAITLIVPILQRVNLDALFVRCGQKCTNNKDGKPSLRVLLDNVSIEARSNLFGDATPDLSLLCHHAIFFALSTVNANSFDDEVRRLDLVALAGRTEVLPYVPISIRIYLKVTSSVSENEPSLAESLFPQTPSLSSFKARQEDEDEEQHITQLLSSNLKGVNFLNRKDLRGRDPQIEMIENAVESSRILEVSMPQIIGDLTSSELYFVVKMLEFIRPARKVDTVDTLLKQSESNGVIDTSNLANDIATLALSIGSSSLALHNFMSTDSTASFTFSLRLSQTQVHMLLQDRQFQQARFLIHDLSFCEIPSKVPSLQTYTYTIDERLMALRVRSSCAPQSFATPILHRSELFVPISRSSPVMLLDWMNPKGARGSGGLPYRSLHLTFYDMTCRYEYNTTWVQRLCSLLGQTQGRKGANQVAGGESESNASSEFPEKQRLIRLFISLADCNIDYSSPVQFETPSRLICRLGDVRISSNVLLPAAPVQAVNLSVGDVSLYLCNRRFPYDFENSRIVGAEDLMKNPRTLSAKDKRDFIPSSSESVLQAMNCRTLVILDTFDAVLRLAHHRSLTSSEPSVQVSFTVGELGVFACKDSFKHLLATIGEPFRELTALNDRALQDLKAKVDPFVTKTLVDEASNKEITNESLHRHTEALASLKLRSALQPMTGTAAVLDRQDDFLLDGYDWTAIGPDEPGSVGVIPPGDEQSARWLGKSREISQSAGDQNDDDPPLSGSPSSPLGIGKELSQGLTIITHHFPLQPLSDPLSAGDMGIQKYAGADAFPLIETRLVLHDMRVKVRLFDGFDWPELIDREKLPFCKSGDFVIDEQTPSTNSKKAKTKATAAFVSTSRSNQHRHEKNRKAKLLGDLLDGNAIDAGTFINVPLPEERGLALKEQSELRFLSRRTGKYIQFSASGVRLRLDLLEKSSNHRLVSCMNIRAHDFFLAETVSGSNPKKMAGEWLNEADHPRDTQEGLFMMKMVTWHPERRVTSDGAIASDICEAAVTILPLRCNLDQRAIRFARQFFRTELSVDDEIHRDLPSGLHQIPPSLFRLFRVRPFKVKVDYTPQKVDRKALKDGAFVELVNLSPIDALILTLKKVEIEGKTGFGEVLPILIQSWIQEICSTQLLKFVTNMRPLEPITQVGETAVDMIVLPWEAFRNGDSVQKAIRSGTTSFASTLVYEAFTATSRVAGYVADQVGRLGREEFDRSNQPSRPLEAPRRATDAAPHALQSVTRGLQEANYKIVIIPYREYQRTGARGAIRSVVKGIPVAIGAPTSAAAEAISYALLGARNQIRPDIRKEEESSQRGMHLDR